MNILLFSSSYAPRVGGLETATRQLASHLKTRGHTVAVVTNRYPRHLPSHETIDGIPVHRYLYPDVLHLRRRKAPRARLTQLLLLPFAPIALVRLALLVRRLHPDVMNVHYFSYPALYALAVARFTGVPAVLSFHGSDLSLLAEEGRSAERARRVCGWARLYTVCSAYLMRQLQPLLASPRKGDVHVTPNGVETSSQVAASHTDEPYVAAAARLIHIKGIDTAVRSLALAHHMGQTVHMKVAGDGEERRNLEQLVETLGIADRVQFLGPLPHDQVLELIRKSALVVVPSRQEGFGLVCLEAMMGEKAVIASRVGGIPEIVVDGETGILVNPEDTDAMAAAMAALAADPDRAADLGKRGRVRAEKEFSWEKVANDYVGVYQQATSRLPSEQLSMHGVQ